MGGNGMRSEVGSRGKRGEESIRKSGPTKRLVAKRMESKNKEVAASKESRWTAVV